LEMSALNDALPANVCVISVTLDTSHSPIGPKLVLVEQSPSSSRETQSFTVFWSSSLDCGENALQICTRKMQAMNGINEFRQMSIKCRFKCPYFLVFSRWYVIIC